MTDNQRTTNESKTDTTGEFFAVGVPLHAVRAGYIRRAADDELFNTVSAGGNAYVIAPDRSGKTSLIAATSARLRSNGVKVAVIDLAQIGERDGGTDAGRWYYNIAYRLLRQLRLKVDLQAWWQDKALISNRQRLVEFYVEVVLKNIQDHIVVFVDEIQCVEKLPFAEHLLASFRAAHNSRETDPELTRLSFVLLGECDPQSLVSHDGLSPFAVSKRIRLTDFTRDELNIFRTELELPPSKADLALDRIYDWTSGQPYLTQKLARSVAREGTADDIAAQVDRIAQQQLAGRAALHSEPHMSHIHRRVVGDRKDREPMLNLYGKMRKGIPVAYAPEVAAQRKLLALGLISVGEGGHLVPRNRVYAAVFTARWANENLPIHWRGPAFAAAVFLVFTAVPFWYTQLLPGPHVRVLSSQTEQLSSVAAAYENLRSFPGHGKAAANLYRSQLRLRAQRATSRDEMIRIQSFASRLPEGEEFANELLAGFWDRMLKVALRQELRDDALLAALECLVVPTPERRRMSANLVGDDYALLVGTVPKQQAERVAYDGENNLISFIDGAQVSQWSMSGHSLQARASWALSALEVTPLVRRLTLDRGGRVDRISLNVRLSHPRRDDIRMKLITPSGRAVELEFEQSDESAADGIRFPGATLADLLGEAISGTWSLSVRDESTAVPGTLAGWSLTINGRTYNDVPERPLEIPDPVARESDDIWISKGGRYAIARALHSDSARVWDLLYAQPARTVSVPADERVLGLSGSAEYLVTSRPDSISLWLTRSGRRYSTLKIGPGASEPSLSDDGQFLLVQRGGDFETTFELWSVEQSKRLSALTIGGSPALFTVSADGKYLAVADYDRAVRIWNLADKQQVAQIDLGLSPSSISLSASGETLGVVHGEQGLTLWKTDSPELPILRERGNGDWQLSFSPSGSRVIAGNSRDGFQVYRSSDGAIAGPPVGTALHYTSSKLLAFSNDEDFVVTAAADGIARFWRAPAYQSLSGRNSDGHQIWRESSDSVSAIAPGGQHLAIGDNDGHVHILSTRADDEELAEARDEISFIGHQASISALLFSDDGSLVASIDVDGAARIWDSASGLPRPFRTTVHSGALDAMEFSPSGSRLAVLGGQRVRILNTENGVLVADIDLGNVHSALAFAEDSKLYLAGESGALVSLVADRTDSWNLRTVWNGPAALRRIAVSASRKHLLIVDNRNQASLLNVQDGKIGGAVLQLPDAVQDIVFSPTETRVLIRTARWIHRASVSPSGLVWLDALHAPKVLRGSGMVLDTGTGATESPDPLGGSVALLTRDSGFAEVAELRFAATEGPALIGPREQLLEEWREKLAVDTQRRR